MKSLIIILVSVILSNLNAGESKAYCLPAVAEALNQAFPSLTGIETNADQRSFLGNFCGPRTQTLLTELRAQEFVEAKAGNSTDVQQWLSLKGFEVSLPASLNTVASVFDIHLGWKEPGVKTKMLIGDTTYRAFKMGTTFMQVYKAPQHEFPIFKLPVEGDFEVTIAEWTKPIEKDLDLINLSVGILSQMEPSSIREPFLTIPEVSLNTTVDISMFNGMKSKEFEIEHSLKKVKLEITDEGLTASSAVVFMTRGISPPSYQIKNPFLAVVTKRGYRLPVFVALCDKGEWKAK